MKQLLGLIGYPLTHSFSKAYFAEKFSSEKISGYEYDLFPLEHISDLPALLRENPRLVGLNVTIPHKVAVLPFLDSLDETASAIGAVNTIKIERKPGSPGSSESEACVLHGYNTDAWGFSSSLRPLLQPWHTKALILGTGGASKAVRYVLDTLGIEYRFVSRRAGRDQLSYQELYPETIREYPLIINTTPLGTFPDTEYCPDLPYEALSERNLLYDLVYNPPKTRFLRQGKQKGATVINGMEMLRLQAEKAWEIWTENG